MPGCDGPVARRRRRRHGRVTPRMPRHISSVVPSPHTTYRSGRPRSAGSLSRQAWSWVQVTRSTVAGLHDGGRDRDGALVVEVPHPGVEQGARPGGAGVEVDADARAQQVHVAGDGAHRRRVLHGARARLGRAGPGLEGAGAQQQETGHHAAGVGAEAGRHVEHGRLAVAQWPGVPGAARHLDRSRQEHRVERRQGPRRESQVDGCAIGRDAVPQVVVHLQDEQRALLQRDADVRIEQALGAARRPGAHPGCVVEQRALRLEAGAPEAGPPVTGGLGIALAGCGRLGRWHAIEDDVVHLGGLARHDVEAGDEGVGGDPGVEHEAAVVVGAAARSCGGVGRRHRHGADRLAGPEGGRSGSRRRGPRAVARPGGLRRAGGRG